MIPKSIEERKLWEQGYSNVACIDEVGRGSLAGSVVAAAVVILPRPGLGRRPKPGLGRIIERSFPHLRDSKKLSSKRREEVYKTVKEHPAIQWGIGIVSEKVIDKINIYHATRLAMERALKNLIRKLSIQKPNNCKSFVHIIIDGTMLLNTNVPQTAIVKGDEKVFSCALASIIAKVTRDRMMLRYHKKYPRYGFDRHKGYGTPLHIEKLKKYGPCAIHRRTFAPLKNLYSITIV